MYSPGDVRVVNREDPKIFYKDFAYSRGRVKLGTIESSVRVFERSGRLRVTIEPIEE